MALHFRMMPKMYKKIQRTIFAYLMVPHLSHVS